MKNRSIYSLFNCKNASQLYKKVKENCSEVQSLIEVINFLKNVREKEYPELNNNTNFLNFIKENINIEGKYAFLLNSQNKLIKTITYNKENEILNEAIMSGAKSTLLLDYNRNRKSVKPTKYERENFEEFKEALNDYFEISVFDNVIHNKDNYYSFLEDTINENYLEYNDEYSIEEKIEKNYVDKKILNLKEIEKSQDFLQHYTEKELVGLSMTKDTEKIKELLRVEFSEENKEIFSIMYINNNNEILKKENIFEGTLTKSSVYPRELAKKIFEFKEDFKGVVCVHNHPGGSTKPSVPDIRLTEKLENMFKYINKNLNDHLIISREGSFSFLENELLDNTYNKEQFNILKKEKNKKSKKIDKELER